MKIRRKLSTREKEYLLSVCKKDLNRNILSVFFWIGKAFFVLGAIGAANAVYHAIHLKSSL